MKHIFLVSMLVFCSSAVAAAAEQGAAASIDLKQDELASLPEGLAVTITPDPVSATFFSPSISGVQWQHSITVSCLAEPVTILEFGYFLERNGQWELPYGAEVPFSYVTDDFAKMFNCPGAELKPGDTCSNELSRSVMDCVPEQLARWYFIGVDAEGNRVKGEANVLLLAEVAPDVQGTGQ